LNFIHTSVHKRRTSISFRPQLLVEHLETRIVPSFADGNGAVITNVTEQNNGAALVLTFDGALNANPSNPAQDPTNTANYAVEVPASNAQIITSNLGSVGINTASYNSSTNQVTLTLGTPLAQGQAYRLFINGTANTENPTAAGLVDANQQPIDGDYDDTASGNFYALFTWTTAGTPLNYTDSRGSQVTLSLTGPGQLNAWRELNGDFNAGDLTAQANLTSPLAVQQLSVAGGVQGQTTLSGSALFPTGSSGVVVIPPTIAGTFTSAFPSYFQTSVPPATPSTPVSANASNLPYTIQIDPVNLPNLPAVQSAVTAQDNVVGSPYQGYWLQFGGRTNGLHSFGTSNNFPPQDENQSVYVVNPSTGQTWSVVWSATNVPAGLLPALYSTNQQSFQSGDTLYTVGGYGAADLGGGQFASYTTYDTLTALSVNGLIQAVINQGDVAGLSQIQQIHDPHFKITGGEMAMLGNQAFLVVGQDFEGEYNPASATGFTQTYSDEIRSFQINYDGQVPGSLGIANYQAQNDQVNFRRRDYNLGDIILSNGQPALQIFGGVFTPGPGTLSTAQAGYRNPILISGVGQTQIGSYQQAFSQYSAPHIGLFDASTGSMRTIFFGGISLDDVDFATGQVLSPFLNFPPALPGLPFVNNVTTLEQRPNGTMQEFEMPAQLPGLFGSEARFFAAPGLAQYGNGVLSLDPLLQQPTTLGYIYGGILSQAGLTSSSLQTMATNAVFKVTLVPNVRPPSNTTLVDSLYQVLLGRPADSAGEAFWVNKLNTGTPVAQVTLGFIDSPEHRTRELNVFYSQFLGRSPDSAGLQFFLNEYAHGATDQQVIAQILNSVEFSHTMDLSGDSGNSVLVTALYTDLLNRTPTTNEETFWVNKLNAGAPFATVVNAFLTSQEYLKQQVDDYYTIYLGRPADAIGENDWIHALQSLSSEQVLAAFLASAEYFGKHPGVS
jgi:hypothetical protein